MSRLTLLSCLMVIIIIIVINVMGLRRNSFTGRVVGCHHGKLNRHFLRFQQHMHLPELQLPPRWLRHQYPSRTMMTMMMMAGDENNDFDGSEFEEALRSMGPSTFSMQTNEAGKEVVDNMRKEQIFRNYPFDNDYSANLPVLPDCNNYYSGKYEEYTWHQNADQVYVYIPIADEVSRKDIDVKFEALSVTVMIDDKVVTKFACLERIIPDGSFWVLETNEKDGKKYLQLDLEKRLRMINWKNLFEEAPALLPGGESESRKKMLEQLFAANKGMSKITGKEPESISDMMGNKELMDMLNRPDVRDEPEYIEEDEGTCNNPFDNTDMKVSNLNLDQSEEVKRIVKEAADKYFGPEEDQVVDIPAFVDTTVEADGTVQDEPAE